MARARNIKPGFLKNEELLALEPVGRILFLALTMLADREGRLEDRPKRIKIEALPTDSCDVDDLLWRLHDHGLVHRYQIGEEKFICIPNFLKHQKPHPKEAVSVIPDISNGYMRSRLGDTKVQPKQDLDVAQPGLFSDSLIACSLNAREKLLPEKASGELTPKLVKTEPRERSQEEKLADEYASGIHKRHNARKCTLREVHELLVRILKRKPKDQQFAHMETIDHNHQAWCDSEEWTKDGCQFCPSLDKWLRPDKERYLIGPPARASPRGKTATIYRTGSLAPAVPADMIGEMEKSEAEYWLKRNDTGETERELILEKWPELRRHV